MSLPLHGLHSPIPGIFPHDPVSFLALVRPDLFTYKRGVVRVETQGICTGHTLMDQGLKRYVCTGWLLRVRYLPSFSCLPDIWLVPSSASYRWNSSNPWSEYSPVSVAWTVNVDEVVSCIKKYLIKQWKPIVNPSPKRCKTLPRCSLFPYFYNCKSFAFQFLVASGSVVLMVFKESLFISTPDVHLLYLDALFNCNMVNIWHLNVNTSWKEIMSIFFVIVLIFSAENVITHFLAKT